MSDPDPPAELVEWVSTRPEYADAKDVRWLHARYGPLADCPHALWHGKMGIANPRRTQLVKLRWDGKDVWLGRCDTCRAVWWRVG